MLHRKTLLTGLVLIAAAITVGQVKTTPLPGTASAPPVKVIKPSASALLYNGWDYDYPETFAELKQQVIEILGDRYSLFYEKQVTPDTGTLGFSVDGIPGSQRIVQARIIRDASLRDFPFWGKWSVSDGGAGDWDFLGLAVTSVTFIPKP